MPHRSEDDEYHRDSCILFDEDTEAGTYIEELPDGAKYADCPHCALF